MTPQEKAKALLKTRTTEQLVSCFEITESLPRAQEIAITRGWILDELKERDPQAFDLWLDDENFDKSPREFFVR